jgi:hypothetical protein
MDWDDVRRIALALPETSEKTSWGNAAWAVRDHTFVWERPLRKTDVKALGDAAPQGPILGVRVDDLGAKEALLKSEPDSCFTTPHFDGYPAVLVQLDHVSEDVLAGIIEEAWLAKAPKRLAKAYIDAAQ